MKQAMVKDWRRQDKTKDGYTSIRGGYGTWHYSPGCIRDLLRHGGFRITEERQL
jgi:tRNA (mo5U34)-methyltransferase